MNHKLFRSLMILMVIATVASLVLAACGGTCRRANATGSPCRDDRPGGSGRNHRPGGSSGNHRARRGCLTPRQGARSAFRCRTLRPSAGSRNRI